jgi:hypothetical protein
VARYGLWRVNSGAVAPSPASISLRNEITVALAGPAHALQTVEDGVALFQIASQAGIRTVIRWIPTSLLMFVAWSVLPLLQV